MKGTIGIEAFLNQTRSTSLACEAKQLEQSHNGEYVPYVRGFYQGGKR